MKLREQYESVRVKNEVERKLYNLYFKPNYHFETIIRETITHEEKFERLTSRSVYLLKIQYDLEIKSNKHNQDEKINIEKEYIEDNACQIENGEKKHYSEFNKDSINKINLEEMDINDNDDVGNLEEIKIYSVNFLFTNRNL